MSDRPPSRPPTIDSINGIDITKGSIDAQGNVTIPVTADTVVRHNPDGSVTIPISDDTFAKIERLRQPGETDSDVLRRLLMQVDDLRGMIDIITGHDGNHRARATKGRR